MPIERAREALAAHGLADRVRETEGSSATVELAAAAIGCGPARIAKSLTFLVDEAPVMIVFAGDARVDNRAFKERFGTKARMIPGDRVEELIGHAPGGVCPFGVNPGVPVYLDESLRRFDVVYPAAGSASSMVELSLAELEQASGSVGWVPVAKLPDADQHSPSDPVRAAEVAGADFRTST